jgi:tetratricopeptide (TPR) repeat protein
MNERSYTNFDLVIEQAGDRYRARVISSPAGQAAVEFDTLFSPLELENFVLRMGRPQRGMRRIDSSEMQTIKTFGGKLFRTVFNDEIYACYLRSLDQVLNQDKGLRIRLRIDVPEFNDLPWEFLYNAQVDQFVALSMNTPIVRYIELPYSSQPLPLKAPMNILVMISSPEEYPPLNVEEEWKRLSQALQPLIDSGQVNLVRLDTATLSALQQYLRLNKVHIFHFIGHGKYFEQQQDGMLLLEDEHGRGAPASGQRLGAILHDHNYLRLVVLNACEGARTSAEDPYAGVAQSLVRQGIPAVLANQFEIFENAAITLAQEFYRAVADGFPVDAALSEARKAIFASNNDVEWGTPVLFMRIPNGVIFRPQKPSERSARRTPPQPAQETPRSIQPEPSQDTEHLARLDHLHDQAREQIAAQDWDAAAASLEQIRQVEPGFRDIEAMLERVTSEQAREAMVEHHLEHGRMLVQAGDWPEALSVLQELVDLAPGHQEAAQLLLTAQVQIEKAEKTRKRQEHLASLYEQARLKMDAQDWRAAQGVLAQIDTIQPGYRDVKDLLASVAAQQARLDEFARLVARGKEFLSARDWSSAAESFQGALQMDAGDPEVQALLARVEKGQLVDSLFDAGRKQMAGSDWPAAVETFNELLVLEPSRADAPALLAEAQAQLARLTQAPSEKKEKPPAARPGSLPEEIRRSRKPTSLPK